MKNIYVEKIFHGDKFVGIGDAFSSKKKAVFYLQKLRDEQAGFVTLYDELNLCIVYKVGGTRVGIYLEQTNLR